MEHQNAWKTVFEHVTLWGHYGGVLSSWFQAQDALDISLLVEKGPTSFFYLKQRVYRDIIHRYIFSKLPKKHAVII